MSTYDDASLITYPSGYKSGVIYSQKPTYGSGDLTFTRASTATRVNADGLIESVASGVPRIDYTGGGCGKFKFEPQRTNSITYSEEFDNVIWTKEGATISANSSTSPDGTATADKLVASTTIERQAINQYSTQTGETYFSVFAKSDGYDFLQITDARNPSFFANFDLLNGVVGTLLGFTSSIVNYGNGWYRCIIYADYTNINMVIARISIAQSASDSRLSTFAGNGTDGVLIWGAQAEKGSYPTSYIPTAGATATRLADNPTLAGMQANGIFGATQGTVILDFAWKESNYIFDFNDTSGTRLRIFNYLGTGFWIRDLVGASWYTTGLTHTFGENTKIGIRWDGTTVTAFQNGVKAASDKTFSAPMAIDDFSGVKISDNQSMMFFPTALTDEKIQEYTT